MINKSLTVKIELFIIFFTSPRYYFYGMNKQGFFLFNMDVLFKRKNTNYFKEFKNVVKKIKFA